MTVTLRVPFHAVDFVDQRPHACVMCSDGRCWSEQEFWRARADEVASEADLALLRRTFALAVEARESGNTPFAALVADAGSNVIDERGNESAPPDGDPTRHAEVVATAAAWHVLGDDGMNQATLYASAEPCVMCSGAAYWTGIGRIVYGMPEHRLLELTGNNPENPTFALPCREVLAHGQRRITVIGPLLEAEALQPHEGYWG